MEYMVTWSVHTCTSVWLGVSGFKGVGLFKYLWTSRVLDRLIPFTRSRVLVDYSGIGSFNPLLPLAPRGAGRAFMRLCAASILV